MRWIVVFIALLGSGLGHAHAQSDEPRVLAWIKPQAGSSELVLVGMDGALETVLDIPANATIVQTCGENAISPNQKYALLFIGNEANGTLYLMEDDQPPVSLHAPLHAMACVGFHGVQFSPDSRYVGFLSYQTDFLNEPSPTSRLLVYDTATREMVGNFENVAAFSMNKSDGVVFVSFFKNADKRAIEVGVTFWDGRVQREVSTLFADESQSCYYLNASVQANDAGRIALALGYRCMRGDGRTQYQLYTVDAAARAATLLLSGQTGGQYFPFTRTNATFIAPDGRTLYVALPDGLANNTGSLYAVSLEAPTLVPIVPQYGVFATLRPPNRPINNPPMLSLDGAWLALATNDPNDNGTLYVVDLNAPELGAITLRVGNRGDIVSEMFFSNDNQRLFYVSGGANGNHNSAFALTLATGVSERISRGRYGQGALAADGHRAALLNWVSFADNKPPYQSIVVLDLETAEQTLLYAGGQVINNELTNAQELRVLAWRARP